MPIAPKRLKLRTSNLIHVFPRRVWTWPLKNFSKRGVCKNLLVRDMHSHVRLLVVCLYSPESARCLMLAGVSWDRCWSLCYKTFNYFVYFASCMWDTRSLPDVVLKVTRCVLPDVVQVGMWGFGLAARGLGLVPCVQLVPRVFSRIW